jgi:hypothetical protein
MDMAAKPGSIGNWAIGECPWHNGHPNRECCVHVHDLTLTKSEFGRRGLELIKPTL